MKTLVAVLMLVMLHLCLIIHCVAEHGNHTNNNNFNSVNFLFIIFKIALQNANVEIVDVEIICIEMKWQSVCDYQSYICYFRQFLQWNAFRGIFCIELNIQVSRITVIIDWFNCLLIN